MLIVRPAARGLPMGQAALDLQSGNLTSVRSEVYFVSRGGDACAVIPRRGVALASSYAGVHRLDIDASWSHVMRRQAAQAGAHSVLEVVTLGEGRAVHHRPCHRRHPPCSLVMWRERSRRADGRGSGALGQRQHRSSWISVRGGAHPWAVGATRACQVAVLALVDATGRGICVYDTHSGTTRRVRGPGARLGAVAWTPDDRYVAYTYEVESGGSPLA